MNPADMDGQAIVDLSQTQKIATQLAAAGTTAALRKATAWLDSIERTPDLSLARRYDNVNLLDTSTRKHQKQIADDYLALIQANRKQEKLLWETAHGFWVALSAAYLECMAHALIDPPSSGTLKSRLPTL